MNRSDKWTFALLVIVFLALQSAASWAETRIGVAASTKPNADGFVGAGSQSLSAGSEVFANETVRTGNLGQADLVFLDQTNLTVGPTSEVLLDKFVYDQPGSKGNVVFQTTRGAFRFVTGTQDHRAYVINTPYGSLGDGSADSARSLEVTVQPLGLREPDNFNREFEAIDREARTIFEPPLHEHDVPNVGRGGLMSYGPAENEQPGEGASDDRHKLQRGRGCIPSGGGTVVEVVVSDKKKPRPDECVTRVRLVEGCEATFTTSGPKPQTARLTEPNQTVCISPTGAITYGSSSTSILGFVRADAGGPPPPVGTTPPPPGVGPPTTPPCTTHCQP
jgi:FecR protein